MRTILFNVYRPLNLGNHSVSELFTLTVFLFVIIMLIRWVWLKKIKDLL